MARKKRRQRSQGEWEQLIEEWESSGQSQAEFARTRGLSQTAVSRWKTRLRGSSTESRSLVAAGFVEMVTEVAPAPAAPMPAAGLVLRVGKAVSLELPEWPSPEYVALIARTYEAVPPC